MRLKLSLKLYLSYRLVLHNLSRNDTVYQLI